MELFGDKIKQEEMKSYIALGQASIAHSRRSDASKASSYDA